MLLDHLFNYPQTAVCVCCIGMIFPSLSYQSFGLDMQFNFLLYFKSEIMVIFLFCYSSILHVVTVLILGMSMA